MKCCCFCYLGLELALTRDRWRCWESFAGDLHMTIGRCTRIDLGDGGVLRRARIAGVDEALKYLARATAAPPRKREW